MDTFSSDAFPHEIKLIDDDINEELLKYFTGEKTGFVQIGKEKWILPRSYIQDHKHLYNFQVRRDDTWVVTYPRSGTTWTQELVWLLANDLNYEEAAKNRLIDRFPFLESKLVTHEELTNKFLSENPDDPVKIKIIEQLAEPRWEILNKQTKPRFIKTHLPFSLLPPNLLSTGCKIIYVARNPKDVAVSFYHFNRNIRTQGYVGDFPRYWDYFQRNLHVWTPYWSHVKEGWQLKDHPNVLFLFYEDMNKDLHKTIETVSKFINKTYTSEQLNELADYLHIDNFKKNNSVNLDILKEVGIIKSIEHPFIRKGKTGNWTELFTPELEKIANEWIAENLKNTDMRFPE